jgi:succinoglycan biosynthesis protein ExoA
MKILYIVHILEDSAVQKRIKMLLTGGSDVSLAGFFRGKNAPTSVGGISALPLGKTRDGALLTRILSMLLAVPKLIMGKFRTSPDVIIARNLECAVLALAVKLFIFRRSVLVYECLDIHRLVLRSDAFGKFMRYVEVAVLRRSKLIILSSSAFATHHFDQYGINVPVLLIENKVFDLESGSTETLSSNELDTSVWKIGWFGIIRCNKSLQLLDRLSRELGGKLNVIIRGKPAYDELKNFQSIVSSNPYIKFEGPYKNPGDLKKIYSEVHFTWAIDYFEEGGNSIWLLPNRLYEGGRYSVVPIALANVETGKWLLDKKLGLVIEDSSIEDVLSAFFLSERAEENWLILRRNMGSSSPSLWTFTPIDCVNLVNVLRRTVC